MGEGIEMDSAGALYVIGYTSSFGAGSTDLVLVKFAANGTQLWNVTWGGASTEEGYDIAMDSMGALYVTGYTSSFGAGDEDLVLVKFAANGTQLWNVTWGGTSGERGYGIAMDSTNALYVTGYTSSFGAGDADLVLIKFATNGTQLWNVTWGGGLIDIGYGIAVDPASTPYVTGYTNSFGAGNADLILIKFATNGTQLWNVTWGGSLFDASFSIEMDHAGALYMTGLTTSFGEYGNDVLLVKFTANGTQLWNVTWNYAEIDRGESVVVDSTGTIYVCGYIQKSGRSDLLILKYGAPPPESSEVGSIPGFEVFWLLLGGLALLYTFYRKQTSRIMY
ncbi:MAG: hypothetical protein ACTSRS_19490 [Candidatus Helarchaeota archaeon]